MRAWNVPLDNSWAVKDTDSHNVLNALVARGNASYCSIADGVET